MSVGCHGITGDAELGTVRTLPCVDRPVEGREKILGELGAGSNPVIHQQTQRNQGRIHGRNPV